MRIAKIAAAITLGATSLAVMSPAAAAIGSNCPRGFELAPVSVLGTEYSGVADQVNSDGMICTKPVQNQPFFIFIDNTAP
jgi:hypothetical protein